MALTRASSKFFEDTFYSKISFMIIFLFSFNQLITDLVYSIFALNLLTVSLNAHVIIIFFLLSSIALVFLKSVPDQLTLITGSLVIFSYFVESLIQITTVKAIVAGIGCASFVIFFPSYLLKESTTTNKKSGNTAVYLGIAFGFSILLAILFRTLFTILFIPLNYWSLLWSIILGLLGLALLLTYYLKLQEKPQKNEEEEQLKDADDKKEESTIIAKKESSFWKILGLSFGIVGSLAIVYFFLGSPEVIVRWVGGNFQAAVILLALMLTAFCILSITIPDFMNLLKPWMIWTWNGLFILSLTLMQVFYQTQLIVLRQILFYLAILLSPIICINFTLLSQELFVSKPTARKLGGGFTISFLFVIILIFGAIFTIAYDYIPVVGPFFRNKHWFVMMFVVLCGSLPILLVNIKDIKIKSKLSLKKPKKKVLISIFSICSLLVIIGGIFALPFPPKTESTPTNIKVVTFNIQQGFDINGNINFSGIKNDLAQIDADIIGLQESDTCRISSGNYDVVRLLAKQLRMYSYFGPKTVTGTFGIALLSKYPISNMKTYYMYSEGEQTATIEAEITIVSKTYNVYVTHFGEYEYDKEKQAERIVELTSGKNNVILLGDFNFEPWSLQYNITTTVLDDAWLRVWPTGIDDNGYSGLTFSWKDPHSHIDFIFVSSDITLTDCRVITSAHSSDHMPVTVTISI